MKKIFLIGIAIFIAATSFAQKSKSKKDKREENRKRINALVKQEEEGVIVYEKHTAYGLKLINDGYGAFLEFGRAKSVSKATLFQLEISERKHVKEEKQENPNAPTAPIIYGKQNFFYPVKLGVQQQFLFGNKSNKNGVSVTGNAGGGLSLGLLRPYMVEVDKAGQRTFVSYQSDSTLFLNGPYYGGPGLGKGWNGLKVTPGAYAKAALRFDYGAYNEILSAIEVGITGEFYFKKIPIMVHNTAKQFFFSGYVALVFGRRK